MRFFFLLFIAVPIAELWLLIQVGSRIGAMTTILLLFLSAALGMMLLRVQGVSTLLRVNQRMQQGELPAVELLEGFALALGGVLLLIPGFISDAVGLLFLLPLTRRWLVQAILQRGVLQGGRGAVFTAANDAQFHRERGAAAKHNILEGEFRRDD